MEIEKEYEIARECIAVGESLENKVNEEDLDILDTTLRKLREYESRYKEIIPEVIKEKILDQKINNLPSSYVLLQAAYAYFRGIITTDKGFLKASKILVNAYKKRKSGEDNIEKSKHISKKDQKSGERYEALREQLPHLEDEKICEFAIDPILKERYTIFSLQRKYGKYPSLKNVNDFYENLDSLVQELRFLEPLIQEKDRDMFDFAYSGLIVENTLRDYELKCHSIEGDKLLGIPESESNEKIRKSIEEGVRDIDNEFAEYLRKKGYTDDKIKVLLTKKPEMFIIFINNFRKKYGGSEI